MNNTISKNPQDPKWKWDDWQLKFEIAQTLDMTKEMVDFIKLVELAIDDIRTNKYPFKNEKLNEIIANIKKHLDSMNWCSKDDFAIIRYWLNNINDLFLFYSRTVPFPNLQSLYNKLVKGI